MQRAAFACVVLAALAAPDRGSAGPREAWPEPAMTVEVVRFFDLDGVCAEPIAPLPSRDFLLRYRIIQLERVLLADLLRAPEQAVLQPELGRIGSSLDGTSDPAYFSMPVPLELGEPPPGLHLIGELYDVVRHRADGTLSDEVFLVTLTVLGAAADDTGRRALRARLRIRKAARDPHVKWRYGLDDDYCVTTDNDGSVRVIVQPGIRS